MQVSTKGQLEIGVTTMVLIVFIVLLLFSLILYFRFTYMEIEETKETLLDQKYNSLLSVIIGMPEFRCSRGGVESECLDSVKLRVFDDDIKDDVRFKEYYKNLFGNVKGIWVEVSDGDPNFIIYGSEGTSGGIYSVPVSVYYPVEKRYRIGILKIRGEI